MKKIILQLTCVILLTSGAIAQSEKPLLLQSPTLSKTQIVFAYGGSLWSVAREGGDARRLVVGDPGTASGPLFSPDGSLVAFTGNFDTNPDVYVVPATGGEPRRLTTHPANDIALGWSPDGKRILFRSARETYSRFEKLYTVSVEGGFPTELPLPRGVQGAYSSDETQLAYVPHWNRGAATAIKNYRGGLASLIWVASLADSSVTPIPREGSNDFNPMWIGDKIYFLSDRAGATTLFSYDPKSRTVTQLLKNDGFDFKSAGAGPGAIVYEQFGSLHLFDLASGKEHAVPVRISADLPQTRPHFEKVPAKELTQASLSPTGARAVFETHGEIVTVPAEKGDIRNLTRTPAVADRDPSWSPDGKTIAHFSDESGEYALHLRDQNGLGTVRKIDLGPSPSFFYGLSWSPDSKQIAYSDKHGSFWLVDLAAGKPAKFDADLRDRSPSLHWSPDSKWLAYVKELPNHHRAIFVYSLDTAKVTQLTDGMSDARSPDWDKSGKYLYFTASTDLGLSSVGFNMSSNARPVTRSVYLAVLAKDLPSPLAPESDEEKDDAKDKDPKKPDNDAKTADEEKLAGDSSAKSETASDTKSSEPTKKKEKAPVKVVIDFEGFSQRILALPLPEKNYGQLAAGKEGIVYVLEGPQVTGGGGPEGGPKSALQRFELKTRKTEKLLDGVEEFHLAAKGEKMLWKAEAKWFIGAADKAPKPGEGALKLDALEVWVEPRAEWRQMYHEVWRIERDFFYDPNFHGLNLAQAERIYAPFLDGLASRADLNYLFVEMLGQFSIQHMYVAGGARPEMKEIKVGLLGADYKIAHDRYQFTRVFDGENWNPHAKAPLTQPGVNVKPGEYLIAVNGRELHATDELFSYFAGTATKQTVLRVGPNPDGTGARDVTVVPVASESSLRNLAWIEGNRRKVDELSGGKVAYVYVPDTAGAGYTSFNRYFFAQVGKQGAVIDERFNGGGQLADYIVDYLNRPLRTREITREGLIADEPGASIYGPKAMLINEFAGSGGDALPWYFRKGGIGTLVGKRTWGGLVGIGGYPTLIDGGTVTAPRFALYGLDGQWEVENIGIAPDVEVEHDPKLVRQGRDPQLEKAVEIVLEAVKKNPPKEYPVPPYPKYPPRWPVQKP